LTIDYALALKEMDEDTFISNFMHNLYPKSIQIRECSDEEKYEYHPNTSITNHTYL